MRINWQTKKLAEICTIIAGQSPEGNFYNEDGIGLPFYQGKKEFGERFIGSPTVWTSKTTKVAEKNDILMCVRAPVGPINFSTQKICIGRGLAIIRSGRLVDKDFLFYFLSFNEENIVGNAGAVFASISKKDIEEIEIPLPPLPEQHRIVKILDEVFEGIAKVKDNTEKNLQNAKELFGSYLQNIFSNPREGWEEKMIGEIAKLEYGYTDKAKHVGDFRFIRITDIDNYGNLEPENKMYVKHSKEAEKYLLDDGDLLMARTGASFADVLLYKNIEKSIFASYLIRVRFTEKIDSKLYWYFSKSRIYWDQANKLKSGSAQPQFNGGALKQLIFTYPKSTSEQKKIVAKLDALSEQTKRLEGIYRKKLADLEELKKSVLKKAFAGEL